jgi:hypothetical protein
MSNGLSPAAAITTIVVIIVAIVGLTIYTRRKGYKGIGGNTIVRCREGHLFTTIWVPGASFKAIRLGFTRYQRCPVGDHWTFVVPVKDDTLTDSEKRFASQHHDSMIP